MIELRFHGRGGQGAVVASKIFSVAAAREGKFVQSFPEFGVERRGAPVVAYARVDDRQIWLRTGVYDPHLVIVLDPSLLAVAPVVQGVREGGVVLVNTDRSPESLGLAGNFRVACIDAAGVAVAHGLGTRTTPIVNTAILGALAKVGDGVIGLPALLEAIAETAPIKTEANQAAAREAHDKVVLVRHGGSTGP